MVEPVVTVTLPVSAPLGTVARIKVVPVRSVVVAAVPPNFTTDDPPNPCPSIPTWVSSLPLYTGVTNLMNGEAPMFSEKKVPSSSEGPFEFAVPKMVPLVCCSSGPEGCVPSVGGFKLPNRNPEKASVEVS